MAIAELLLDNASKVQKDLDYFIEHYPQMPDEGRMELSTQLFGHMGEFFKSQEFIVQETSQNEPAITKAYAPYQQAHEDILDTFEKMIMIHVDEPDDEYRQRLGQIESSFQLYRSNGYQDFISKLEKNLNPEAETALIQKMKMLRPAEAGMQ